MELLIPNEITVPFQKAGYQLLLQSNYPNKNAFSFFPWPVIYFSCCCRCGSTIIEQPVIDAGKIGMHFLNH
jgi:predicted Zn-ribbon and HTH transcriptional regulator